mmetsp:Transcript_1664/g.2248  ORF Transcript_1664/g.2248 Transcript_1664/m.2248 type:complete len:379 (+) Transcript_1664:103-1239(+)
MRAHCKCLNTTLHLSSDLKVIQSSSSSKYNWFLRCSRSACIFESQLSFAGIVLKYDFLGKTFDVERDGKKWRIHRCSNCRQNVCAVSDSTFVLLSESIVKEEHVEETKASQNFSKTFGLLVCESLSSCSSTLLQTPDPQDQESFHNFRSLQKRLESFVENEAVATKKRIEEYAKKQNEQLQLLESKAFQERKLLWNAISEDVVDKEAILLELKATSTSTTMPQRKVDSKSDQKKSSSSKKSSSQNQRKGGTKKSSNWAIQPAGRGTEDPLEEMDMFLPGSVDTTGDFLQGHEEVVDIQSNDDQSISTSVPLSIPGGFSNWSAKKPDPQPGTSKSFKMRPPHELVDAQDQREYGSFAVPVSRNRTRARARTVEKNQYHM